MSGAEKSGILCASGRLVCLYNQKLKGGCSMRKSVVRAKHGAPRFRDRTDVWAELLQSLNRESDQTKERQEGLHKMVCEMLDHGVNPRSPAVLILQHFGDRWSPFILCTLFSGTYRHRELQRVINVLQEMCGMNPVSQRMLTLKLRMLERDGLVTRKVWPKVPPRTDYALTVMGRSLTARLFDLLYWCDDHRTKIIAAQEDYDRRTGDEFGSLRTFPDPSSGAA